jgi:lambda family phage portal protein
MAQVPAILGPDGQAIRRGRTMARAFVGASHSHTDLADWTPSSYSGQGAIDQDRDMLVRRLQDLARNDGWASAGVTRLVDTVIGAGWDLTATPNFVSLGIDPDAADDLAEQIEAKWEDYAYDPSGDCFCHAKRQLNMGGILALAFRHRITDGEALAAILWIRERRVGYRTAVQVIDPDRLSTPNGEAESETLRKGVRLGKYGEPLGYYIRAAHPADAVAAINLDPFRWEYVPRETSFQRRVMVHAYEPNRAGGGRATPLLAPIIKKLRMLGRYDEAELQAAVLNAVMAAFIESAEDHDQIADAMNGGDELTEYQKQRMGYYEEAPLRMPGVKVNFLFPGEKATLTRPSHPNAVFEPFVKAALRNIAGMFGLSYEQLSMDWGESNYSSARAALIEVWRGVLARREIFAYQFQGPIYAAWLEEAIDRGEVKLPKGAPAFRQAKPAYCSASWIGPGRGWVDPKKEAEGAILRKGARLTTLQRECAEQGLDWRQVIRQLARERKEIEAAGMDPDAQLPLVHPSGDQTDEPKRKAA